MFFMEHTSSKVIKALAKAGSEAAPFDQEKLRNLTEYKRQNPASVSAPIAVIWDSPERHIARAILKGGDPAAITEKWEADAQQLIALFRLNRRHITLIESAMLADEQATQQHRKLRDRLGLADLELPLKLGAGPDSAGAEAEIAQIADLAGLVLRDTPASQDMLKELQASSICLDEKSRNARRKRSPLSLLAAWNGERGDLIKNAQKAFEQQTEAETRIAEIQSDLAKALTQAAERESEIKQALKNAKKAKAVCSEASAEVEQTAQERRLLRDQVALQLDEMATTSKRLEVLEKQMQDLKLNLRTKARSIASLERERAALKQELREKRENTASAPALFKQASGMPSYNLDLIESVSLAAGTTREDGVIRISSDACRKHAFYGPYLQLEPGDYEITIGGTLTPDGIRKPVAVADLAINANEILLARKVEGKRFQSHPFILREAFSLTREMLASNKNGLEVRLWTDGISSAEVTVAHLRKTQ